MRSPAGPLLAVALLAPACVTVDSRAGFDDVEKTVAERTGMRVRWNQDGEEDRAILEMIEAKLREPLGVDDAVQIALLRNHDLQATYEELGTAQADLVQAGMLSNPSVHAEVRFAGRPAIPFEIDVAQSFLDLFLIPLRKRVAAAAFEAAKLRVTDAVLGTAAQVKVAFYQLQSAEQMVEMRRSVEAATADSADAAQRLHAAGNITDLQLAEREMLHEQARLDLASAELMVLDRREELSALMGVWGRDTVFTVATRLPELPQGEISLLGLESLAVSQRADLAAARHEIESIAESLGIDKVTGVVPQLALVGHYERELEGPGTGGPSLELTLPIFDQGQAKIAAASARLRQSEQRFAALAIQIRSDVRRLRNRLLSARSRTEYLARVILPLRHRVVEQTQLEYNAMVVNVFQLLQSKQAEIETGREYIEALRDYWVARAELERSVGGRFAAPDEPSANAGGQS